MPTKSIKLQNDLGETVDAIVTYELGKQCHLTLQYLDDTITRHGPDMFSCFKAVRQELEKQSLIPLCAGAAVNACVSPMSLQSTQGMFITFCTLGRRVNQTNGSLIFEEERAANIGSVIEQEEYFNRWLSSLQ